MLNSIPADKLKHVAMGCVAVVAGAIGVWLHLRFGLGPALAYFSTALGVGYEVVQRVRKEGLAEPLDALSTAAPGWAAWALIAATGA